MLFKMKLLLATLLFTTVNLFAQNAQTTPSSDKADIKFDYKTLGAIRDDNPNFKKLMYFHKQINKMVMDDQNKEVTEIFDKYFREEGFKYGIESVKQFLQMTEKEFAVMFAKNMPMKYFISDLKDVHRSSEIKLKSKDHSENINKKL